MPRRCCNIICSSGELEKSYLLQKLRLKQMNMKRTLMPKALPQPKCIFQYFQGWMEWNSAWGIFKECAQKPIDDFFFRKMVRSSHTGHACFNSTVFEYPTDLIDFLKNVKSACKFYVRFGLILCLELILRRD